MQFQPQAMLYLTFINIAQVLIFYQTSPDFFQTRPVLFGGFLELIAPYLF